ncbi:MAG: hypothetical protein ACR2MO_02550 [Acidimicrobiales bacterium]
MAPELRPLVGSRRVAGQATRPAAGPPASSARPQNAHPAGVSTQRATATAATPTEHMWADGAAGDLGTHPRHDDLAPAAGGAGPLALVARTAMDSGAATPAGTSSPAQPELRLARPAPAPSAAPATQVAPTVSASRPAGGGGGVPAQRQVGPTSAGSPPQAAVPHRPATARPDASPRPPTAPVQRTVTASRAQTTGAPTGMSGTDVDALVEKVLRKVRDQLRVDRERRGSIADRRL